MSCINVILSGGVGSRLWPLSRKSRPKQYIPLFQNRSLFQLCALRNRPVCGDIIVVGNRRNSAISRKDLAQAGIGNYREITEAAPRNTAAAIAFAAFATAPEDVLLVTPSDHVVGNQQAYEQALSEAFALAEQNNLVTFGIPPHRPETGYGYIRHRGNQVQAFIEKPGLDKAKQMLQEGGFLWNSGMFCFKSGVFLEELKKHAPEVAAKAFAAWEQREGGLLPEAPSLEIPSISVDYAVMEHSDRIKVVPSKDLGWSDMGTFDALWEYLENSSLLPPETEHLVLHSAKPVFFIGNQQMIYVETEDAVLILPRGKGQEVKELYEQLSVTQPGLVE